MSKLFVSCRTRAAAWVILLVLPALMAAFGYYHSHRPAVNPVGSRTFWDYVILNSDILLGLLFLLASAIPFLLVFDKKKPQARELVPIAVMAAIAVVGRTVFEIIPLPNFKPCSAIIIITAVAFGPEAGFLTGTLTGFVSNFIFGQGPWTPWQMFTWGLVGFLAGILKNAGVFKGRSRRHFAAQWWDRLCPENTNRGDLLHFVRQLTDHAPLRLCLYGFLSGFLYGWIMNLYFIIGYVSPLTWQTVGAAYVRSYPRRRRRSPVSVFRRSANGTPACRGYAARIWSSPSTKCHRRPRTEEHCFCGSCPSELPSAAYDSNPGGVSFRRISAASSAV